MVEREQLCERPTRGDADQVRGRDAVGVEHAGVNAQQRDLARGARRASGRVELPRCPALCLLCIP
jgi:hypothetical protein